MLVGYHRFFMIFAGVYYWFPKATGRLLSERLGKWHFWVFFIGYHLCFDTMHIPGILGMPWAGFITITKPTAAGER